MSPEKLKPRKLSRGSKFLIFLAVAFIFYTVAGFWIVPAVVRTQLVKRVSALLKRPVAVAEVKVNPYTLSATINGFAINETNGSPFAGWDEFHARLRFSSFVSRGWSVGEITLTHPFAHLARATNGGLNFDDILATLAATSSPTPAPVPAAKTALPNVRVDSIVIDKCEITVDDAVPAKPVHTKILPLRVQLDHLSTAGGAHNPYQLHAQSDSGEIFAWTGAFTLDPPQVTGSLVMEQVDLKKYSPYLAQFANAEITDGRLDVKADYTAGLLPGGPEVSVKNTEVSLKSFALKSTLNGETVVTVPSFALSLTEADLGRRLLHLASLRTSDGSLLVRREADGGINLLGLLKPIPPSPPAKGSATNALPPWAVSLDELVVTNYALNVEDKVPSPAAKLSVDQIALDLKHINLASNDPVDLNLAVRIGTNGHFQTGGTLFLQPPAARLTVQLSDFDLRPLQPYVQQQLQLAVTDGRVSLAGQAEYNQGSGHPLAAFAGDFSLTNFCTADLLHFKDFVKLDSLSVNHIDIAFQPNRLSVGEVALGGLNTTVRMDADKKLNLLTVLPAKPAAPNAALATTNTLDFPLALNKFSLANASFHFVDESIEPNCLFDVQQLDGSVTGLSSLSDSRASVDMHGRVDDVSPFSISGTVQPLSKDLSVDMAIDCKNVNLTPFTPYMEKFGGYPLRRGKLLLDLHEKVQTGALDSSNHVIIAGLTLGAKTNSPEATHLPVKLGIALLKDREGNIVLDVPVTGRLDDPNIRIWPIARKVIVDLLEKAAASPFKLLGSMFGGGEELSYIDFQPGLAAVAATDQPKLDKLTQALYSRPELELEIAASADPQSDAPVLARLKLTEEARSLRARELTEAGTPPDSVQSVVLDPTNYLRLLKELYVASMTNTPSAPESTNTLASPSVTNNVSESVSAPSLASPSSVRAVFRQPLRGVELLTLRTASILHLRQPAPSLPVSSSTNFAPAPAAPVVAVPVNSATPEQMETYLLSQTQVTPDDLRGLMQARARAIQSALAASGKVEPDRLFLLAPQPVNMNSKGEARANLTLD